MQKILETDLCKIYYSESLQKLATATVPLLEQKIIEYNSFFGVSSTEKIIVNYFDTVEEFREFIYEIRGERDSLPDYARGTYDKGMVNACIEPQSQLKRLNTASHELFHIMYMKYILDNDYSKRIVWYDEGMAQFMSGEKDSLKNEQFKDFYMKVKKATKVIPQLNTLNHGDTFVNKDYDGYDLCYLSVRYLSEVLSDEEFKSLLSDFHQISQLGEDILQKMFHYYDEKINKNYSITM